jgi:riboflavin biosynthesis pyrimidine reductase
MRILAEDGLPAADAIARHVAVPADRAQDKALVRLNMIASADGASEVSGRSGALGNHDDSLVFGGLRAAADAVVVGLATAVSEQYHAPTGADAPIYVVAKEPDVSGDPELFATGRATLVLPEDSGPAPEGVAALRFGTGGRVDLARLVAHLAGQVVMFEGGPSLAGAMVSLGLVDEFFLSLAPRVIGGGAARVVHGPDADTTPWVLAHVLVDDEGFVFLRYRRA